MRPLITLKELLSEFLSTFKEWHYFVGGIAVGGILFFITGWVLSRVIDDG